MKRHDLSMNGIYLSAKYGGQTLQELDIQLPGLISEQSGQTFHTEELLELLIGEFESVYGMRFSGVEMIERYQRGITICAISRKDSPAIYMDELFQSTLSLFLALCFWWAKDLDDVEMWNYCFQFLFSVFYSQCVLGEAIGEKQLKPFLEILKREPLVLSQASDCYWSILAFLLAHELSHLYLEKVEGTVVPASMPPSKRYYYKLQKEEFKADRMAYDLFLRLLIKDSQREEKERTFFEYTYLAPMMVMDYFDLIYYTDRVLHKVWLTDMSHPLPIKRKNQLFGIAYDEKYKFQTEEGNALYQWFIDVTDKCYKDNLLLKMERHKLDSVIQSEKRRILLKNQDHYIIGGTWIPYKE